MKQEWKYIDDARGYKRADGAFNRMAQCRHGVMLFNPLDWYIGRSLEVYGEWGEKKVQIWRKIVKPGQVAVDIGAHIGTLTLPLSQLVGVDGRVFAFEPFYPSSATLAANVGVNSLQNVEVRQAVVADRTGKVFMNRKSLAFEMHDFFNFGSMNYNSLRVYNTTDDVERPSTDWDEYQVMPLDQMSVSRLDFLKIDAEAMELAVLNGAQRIIKRFKPVVFLEYRNPWEKDTNVLDLLRKKMKYECVLLRLPIFNADNYRDHKEDIWGGGGGGAAAQSGTKIVSFNLLCKHRWWEYPDMDAEVLELFDTAVDTDIEGLRTTPTADPFEAMTLSRQGAAPTDDRASPEQGGARQPPKRHEDRAPVGGSQQPAKRQEEMTLEELLDEGDEAFGEKSEEVSLDDLLGPEPAPPAPEPKRAKSAKPPTKSGKSSEKSSKKSSKSSARPAPPPAADPAASSPKKPAAAKTPAVQKRYEEMTLDELLEESWPEGRGKNHGKADADERRTDEELNLDELLNDLDNMGKGQKQAEELSLDDLLGPEPGDAKELSLDDLLGPKPSNDGSKRLEDMSLDELLGPEPSTRNAVNKQQDERLIDELLGDPAGDSRYEEMSLDELLNLDEPVKPAKQKKKAAGDAKSTKAQTKKRAEPEPKKQTTKSAGKAESIKDSGEAKSKKRKAKAQKAAKPAAKVRAEPKTEPPVRIRYEDEITLDEL